MKIHFVVGVREVALCALVAVFDPALGTLVASAARDGQVGEVATLFEKWSAELTH